MKHLLIAFCGLDGSGKTTQLHFLKHWMFSNQQAVLTTRQPSDDYRNNDRVRNYLDNGVVSNMKAIALLAAADRQNHISEIILPGLEKSHVLTDRYLYSSFAFFKARGLNIDFVRSINPDIPEPDLTVFLDLDPKVTLERVSNRDGSLKFEERNSKIFEDVRETFLKVLPKNSLILDAQLSENDIHKVITNKVKELLNNDL
ncbi:dTMP kinase [Leuconostoc mesenteroides]|uniref:dTMP kinase n=1 Tax=Leuconostoc mesenteroides TaxID=1245 RepID=UPI0005A921C0|nr:dTMP kinase [Leuconostoc mesenteroides]KAA8380309.1 dTMP kinase [Leuconostoc mesenteroides]